MQLQAADAGTRLGPLEARVLERDGRRIEQPDQPLAVAAQRPRRHRQQRRRDVAEHRPGPRPVGVRQGRAARRSQIEVVERGALPAQGFDNLPQALQAGKLGEQQRLQVALAGPGVVARADPMVAGMHADRPSNHPAIQRFQKIGKRATHKRHGGRLRNHVWQHDSWPQYGRPSAMHFDSPPKSRTAMGADRDDESVCPFQRFEVPRALHRMPRCH